MFGIKAIIACCQPSIDSQVVAPQEGCLVNPALIDHLSAERVTGAHTHSE